MPRQAEISSAGIGNGSAGQLQAPYPDAERFIDRQYLGAASVDRLINSHGRHSGRASPCEREPESSIRRGSFFSTRVQPPHGESRRRSRE
jgi:hypothetical protein